MKNLYENDVEEFDVYNHAPSKEYIDSITDSKALYELRSEIEDVEIAIGTQLEFYNDNDSLKHRRVAAIIHWRKAFKNVKYRLITLKELNKNG